MQNESKRVLDMLQSGKITSDEAEQLLSALDAPSVKSQRITEIAADRPDHYAGPSDATGAEHESYEDALRKDMFTVEGVPSLIVDNFNGRVEVTGDADDGVVHVVADLRHADRIDYSAVQEGDTIRIEAKPSSTRSFMGWLFLNRGVHVRVRAPRRSNVDVRNSNGRITISDIQGAGSLHTSNGRIEAKRVIGPIEMTTSNSRIDARQVEGDLSVESSNGRITVVDARGTIRVETSNGSIRFDGELTSGGSNTLRTSNGSIDVGLRGEPSVRLKAATSNGSIRSRNDIDLVGEQGKRRLNGVIGGGDADLTLRTSNGSITIE